MIQNNKYISSLHTPEPGSIYTLCVYTNNVSLILIIIVFFLYKILSLLLMSKTLRHLLVSYRPWTRCGMMNMMSVTLSYLQIALTEMIPFP